ncbi:PLP-dependent aminotransferase family protein [Isoptericola variabilis]|uniref:Transcriptional regulator, GntR family with aminotransferase domain n=1 Tax=Isoptericola variabilis (strain 225) TaxID=743718 RepID=F6FWZ0_ISOV2|nr:PLP-dependent aminotransferase family protein [Isoptericola variabilis]AEG44590.1 transcriptional regulator, GntR family with aminotransferase domain [Isoptericola variabilis 225]TWH28948.1 DNA-binding transcriptional MocR family regulator [Isoptericola variabilis J7]
MTTIAPGPAAVRHLSPAATARLLGDWRAGGPAYVALADAVRSAVLSGTLAPLTRLPSERDLAAALGVSRTTTAAAYARLRELGFAVSRVGSGTVAVLPGRPAGAARARTAPRVPAGDAPAPEGPARDGEPPGSGAEVDRAAPLDLGQATPSAVPALHAAFERALEALPAYLGTGGYAHHGIDPLRAAVADRYTARGVPTTPDQVLVTTGAQQAIALLAATFVGAREAAVVESPTYFHAIDALRRTGARVVGVPAGDVETLASAVRRTRPRLVYLVPDFHNPTGRTLGADERALARDVADRFGVTVVGDETLTDLALDPGAAVPAPFAGDGTSPWVVSVGSASKSLWGGLRVGWVRAPEHVVQRLARTRQAVDIATAVLEQLAVVELLARREEILPARLADLRARRDLLVGGLREALPAWDVPSPPGGLCVWAGLGRPAAQAFAAAAVAEGVRVTPGPVFTPDGGARDRVRLTFTRTPDELQDAVARLARAWRRVAGS